MPLRVVPCVSMLCASEEKHTCTLWLLLCFLGCSKYLVSQLVLSVRLASNPLQCCMQLCHFGSCWTSAKQHKCEILLTPQCCPGYCIVLHLRFGTNPIGTTSGALSAVLRERLILAM